MEVVDARERSLLDAARGEARAEALWVLVWAGLTGLTVAAAVREVPGVPGWLWWVLVGVVAAEAVGQARQALGAWREYRDVVRCATCRAAALALTDADHLWGRCARSRHGRRVSGGGSR